MTVVVEQAARRQLAEVIEHLLVDAAHARVTVCQDGELRQIVGSVIFSVAIVLRGQSLTALVAHQF
jgi:hypothetical protein